MCTSKRGKHVHIFKPHHTHSGEEPKLKGTLFNERIADVFRRFQWKSTSTYAKVEFGNVVLAQAEYFLRKIDEFQSLEKTQDFIGNVLPHRLHSAKVTWSFNLLKVFGANDAECTERARHSLRRLMKLGVGFVEQLSDRPLVNGTDCYWARSGVQKRSDGRLEWQTPICKRSKKRCRLDEFFTERREVFKRIKDTIDAMSEEEKTPSTPWFLGCNWSSSDRPRNAIGLQIWMQTAGRCDNCRGQYRLQEFFQPKRERE